MPPLKVLVPDQYDLYCAKYEELEKIGQGGMASIWKVRRRADDQIFAAKKDTQGFGQASSETKKLQRLKSEFIVGYQESFQNPNESETIIILEFCGGGDLSGKL